VPESSVWPGGALIVYDYAPNRTCSFYAIDERTEAVRQRADGWASASRGWWGVRDGKLTYTYDLNLGRASERAIPDTR
jgi:hypothetical protein